MGRFVSLTITAGLFYQTCFAHAETIIALTTTVHAHATAED